MASADFANLAAATSAGYKEVVNYDNASGRYVVLLEKPITGDPDGGAGGMFRGYGGGTTQAAAETAAVAALNHKRLIRYGADTGSTSTGKKNSAPHVRDVT